MIMYAVCMCVKSAARTVSRRALDDLERSARVMLKCSALAAEMETELDENTDGDLDRAEEFKAAMER